MVYNDWTICSRKDNMNLIVVQEAQESWIAIVYYYLYTIAYYFLHVIVSYYMYSIV